MRVLRHGRLLQHQRVCLLARADVCSRSPLVNVVTRAFAALFSNDFGYVEGLLRDALTSFADERKGDRAKVDRAKVGTKGGMKRLSAESSGWRTTACKPDDLYQSIERSRQRLLGDQSSEPLFLWQVIFGSCATVAPLITCAGWRARPEAKADVGADAAARRRCIISTLPSRPLRNRSR